MNNDDNGQMPNNKIDTDDINDKNAILNPEQINKTPSNSNVFSRIMHSEHACSITILINKINGCCLLSIFLFLSYCCCHRI